MSHLGTENAVSDVFRTEPEEYVQILAIFARLGASNTGARAGGLKQLADAERKHTGTDTYFLVDTVDPGDSTADAVDERRHLTPISNYRHPRGRHSYRRTPLYSSQYTYGVESELGEERERQKTSGRRLL